ncbi:MAG: hypothetical protein WCR58_10670 [Bacteroidales bacterium]|jgi:hypothetical protein|nr:hypothetical protein [Bacteroidales bacterium]MDD3701021.1 hypothetical protein [Bacteroidales bacterium]MDY0370247.1 hypothetical protein [Bacteroidales bacterium]
MRKLNSFLLLSLFVGATLFTGCNKDEDDPIIGNPSIDFKGGEAYVSQDATITTVDEILIGFNAAQNPDTKKPLTRFTLQIGEANLVDSTLNTDSFEVDYTLQIESVGEAKLTARITDESGAWAEVSLILTVEDGGVKVKKSEEILLGNVNDLGAGSFYSVSEDEVYFTTNVTDNTDKVDIIFFKGPQNQNTLASPDDDAVKEVYSSINNWPVHNQTRFQLTDLTVDDFDAIAEFHVFPEFTGELTRASHLENEDILYFKTEAGKHGYIKIINLYTRGDVALIQVIAEE